MSLLNTTADPISVSGWEHTHDRKGFFTDTSICIGCKACEVACKEWNRNPQDGNFELLGSSFDNTGSLGANTWRHVAFIEQSEKRIEQDIPNKGTANKCTLCYDRLKDGQQPACAQTCPTTSIKFGDREDMVAKAKERVKKLHEEGMTEARLYGANPNDGVGGLGSVFLLLDEPEVYGLPPDPRVGTMDLPKMYGRAALAAGAMIATTALMFVGGKRK